MCTPRHRAKRGARLRQPPPPPAHSNAALKGVDRQQHTAGPAARRTKVNHRASILTDTCKRCGVSGVRFKISPTTAISAARSAQTAKIATQQLTAFIRQDPGRHVKPMIQARVGIQIV